MAAATMAGPDALRMEQKKLEYFSSINSMARKIMQEREKVREQHGAAWEQMSSSEQDAAVDSCLMDPHRERYLHRADRDHDREEVVCYPKLLLQTGQKIVHFGDEDITWQDEHSAPFSWETKSQLDFSLTSGPTDLAVSSSQSDSKTKPAQTSQLSKPASGTKASGGEGPARRAEEEFWKLSAERSRLEGEQADFHSLTPSQIKSMEKGEKPLPSYLRQETSVTASPKEPEASDPPHPPPPSRSKQRAPKPPAPPPPVPVAVTTTPAATISIAPSPAPASVPASSWERGQSTLPSVSNVPDDLFSSGTLAPKAPAAKTPVITATAAKTPAAKPPPVSRPSGGERKKDKRQAEENPPLATSPAFAQFNTSSNILKTGFDFLDNW